MPSTTSPPSSLPASPPPDGAVVGAVVGAGVAGLVDASPAVGAGVDVDVASTDVEVGSAVDA
jgi:hypothetical protein